MGILPSKLPFSRKHHVSSRTQVGACSRVRQASRNFNLFSDYSNIAHRSETHRKASKGRLNCSEGRGHRLESSRVRQFSIGTYFHFTTAHHPRRRFAPGRCRRRVTGCGGPGMTTRAIPSRCRGATWRPSFAKRGHVKRETLAGTADRGVAPQLRRSLRRFRRPQQQKPKQRSTRQIRKRNAGKRCVGHPPHRRVRLRIGSDALAFRRSTTALAQGSRRPKGAASGQVSWDAV